MSNARPLFSVVVPLYNSRAFVEECLDSLLAQTYHDFEVVIVDDGSTDGSGAIADRYAAEHESFRVFHQENAGSVMARKKGCELATGAYILHVDSDDFVSPDFLSDFAAETDAARPDVVVSGHTRVDGETRQTVLQGMPAGRYDRSRIEQELLPHLFSYGPFFHFGVYPSLCLSCIRRELMQESQSTVPASISLGDDLIVTYPCLYRCQSLSVIGSTGYFYRQQSASQTHSFDERLHEKLVALFDYIERTLPPAENARDAYLDYVFYQTALFVSSCLVFGVRSIGYKACRQRIAALLSHKTVAASLDRPASFVKSLPRKWRIKYELIRRRWLRLYKLMTRL